MRTATIAAALLFGAVAVTFAVGLGTSIGDVQAALNRDDSGAVTVSANDGGTGPRGARAADTNPADAAAITAAIRAQPGTEAYYGISWQDVDVSGIAGTTSVVGYQGDSSWAALQMVAGTWFTGPGEAVVPTAFLQNAGVSIGDSITLTDAGRTVRLRVVGEAVSLRDSGNDVYTDYSTFTALGIDMPPQNYQIELEPGTAEGGYIASLSTALGRLDGDPQASADTNGISPTVLAMDTLIIILTVMLVAVAGLGVLNTVVLDTRERVHDFGVFKALGMTPRQTVAMVLTSVGAVALPMGIVAVPIGVLVHDIVVPVMGHAAGTNLPPSDVAVYGMPALVLLAFGGLAIAMLGALMPAGWAARTGTATALRTE
ncbi:MAG TPA: ABC transporter permease [Actinocrinis sp.]